MLGVRVPPGLPFVNGSEIMNKKIITYYRLAREELSKVIFPTKEQIRNALISVAVVVVSISIFLAIVDLILSASVSSIL
ncbi:putative preprotein translocase SecE subunit [Helicobacter mustelae 12198]|uniref:Protein translocase subunit SecE n=2 Tax=Helicobacter mustelae TaxID=217 RepID=D3UGF4_HELM1|nr:putative preprotein translocase SecE subunit [Helicobacter mustelae 12198]